MSRMLGAAKKDRKTLAEVTWAHTLAVILSRG